MLHLFEVLERESHKAKKENPVNSFKFKFEERIEVSGQVQYKNIDEVKTCEKQSI